MQIFHSQWVHHFLCKASSDSPTFPQAGMLFNLSVPWHLDFPHHGSYGAIVKYGLFTCPIAHWTASSRKAGPCPFLSLLYCQGLAYSTCSINHSQISKDSVAHYVSLSLSLCIKANSSYSDLSAVCPAFSNLLACMWEVKKIQKNKVRWLNGPLWTVDRRVGRTCSECLCQNSEKQPIWDHRVK